MLLDSRNGAAYDLSPCDGERRTYVVASTPRSGSTLLCRGLWDTGQVGAPKEYMNPTQLRDWEVRFGGVPSSWAHRAVRGPGVGLVGRWGWSPARREAHLERVMARRTGSSGWFGLKLHRHHAQRWFAEGAFPVPVARWIWIRRRDVAAQAVSWARAAQTGRWASWQRGLPPVYSAAHIRRREVSLRRHDAQWASWFERHGVEPLVLHYEDLVNDWSGELGRVLTALDAAGPVPPMATTRQSDALSEAWLERYRGRSSAPTSSPAASSASVQARQVRSPME